MDKNKFLGKWRICEMEQWDQDFIDAEVPGYISFSKDGMGEFQFGYVHGFMDCRYSEREGNEAVEFSWEGNDEMDQASGRGFAIIKDKNPTASKFSWIIEKSCFKRHNVAVVCQKRIWGEMHGNLILNYCSYQL